MSGTRIDNAMLPRQERILPLTKTPRENFSQNVFEAKLMKYTGSGVGQNWGPGELHQGAVFEMLLFTQDVPVELQLTTFYGVATAPDAFSATTYIEYPGLSSVLVGNSIFTPDVAQVGREQQVAGATLTNAVRVTGYFGGCTIVQRSLFNIAAELTPTALLMCIAKGAVDDGPVWSYSDHADGTYLRQPVILLESTYTQAIKDAGNTITDGTITYDVCGLYTETVQL